MNKLALYVLFFVFLQVTTSATDWSGTITGIATMTADGNPHRLVGALTVETGGELIIHSGCIVQFSTGSTTRTLTINGKLTVYGTSNSKVVFSKTSTNYSALTYLNATAYVDITYLVLESFKSDDVFEVKTSNAVIGPFDVNNCDMPIRIDNANPAIHDLTITGGAGYGVRINNASPRFHSLSISNKGSSCIYISGTSSPLFESSTITASGANQAINSSASTCSPVLLNNTFTITAQTKNFMTVGLNSLKNHFNTNIFNGRNDGVIKILSTNTLNSIHFYGLANVANYEISGNTTITQGDTLNITGATIKLNTYYIVINGIINIDSNSEISGSSTNPTYSSWGPLTLNSTASGSIKLTKILHCSDINVYTSNITFNNVEIKTSYGLDIDNASPNILNLNMSDIYSGDNCIYLKNSQAIINHTNADFLIVGQGSQIPIKILTSTPTLYVNAASANAVCIESDANSLPKLNGSSFNITGTSEYYIKIPFASLTNLSMINFQGLSYGKIYIVGGTSSGNINVSNYNDKIQQYDFANTKFEVKADDTLRIAVPIKMAFTNSTSSYLNILGTILSYGTSLNPVVFTTFGSTGSWGGINIASNTQSHILHSVIEKANYGLDINNNSSVVEYSRIINNSTYGIYVNNPNSRPKIRYNEISGNPTGIYVTNSARPAIYANKIEGNSSYGIRNYTPSTIIEGRMNYWGSSSGPGSVGPGTGDKVSSGVKFQPWINSFSPPFTGNAPLEFLLISPANNGQIPTGAVTFTWEEALDIDESDAVTYNLQVALDDNFTNIVVNENTANTFHTVNTLQTNKKYYWKVIAKDISQLLQSSSVYTFNLGNPTIIDNAINMIPTDYVIFNAYPNPFNPITTLKYGIPVITNVNIALYDVLGNLVSILVNEQMNPGYYIYKLNSLGLSSGTYILRIQAGEFIQTRKLVLMK